MSQLPSELKSNIGLLIDDARKKKRGAWLLLCVYVLDDFSNLHIETNFWLLLLCVAVALGEGPVFFFFFYYSTA